MHALSDQDMLRACEEGQGVDGVGQALLLLAAACPEIPSDRLPTLSIGQRDALLLRVRELTFGSVIQGVTDCAHCGAKLTFETDTRALSGTDAPKTPELIYELQAAGVDVRFRLLNGEDLRCAERCADAQTARQQLLARCVLHASRDGTAVDIDSLPGEVIEALAMQLSILDPLAEIRLGVDCPECGRRSETLLDIAGFLWAEMVAQTTRLFYEVDVLARAYGWHESDILSLSPVRRQRYLEIVGA